MIAKGCVVLLSLYLALAGGCGSNAGNDKKSPAAQQAAASNEASAPPKGKVDACALLTSEDIQAVQGEGVRDAKGSEQTDGPLSISQCFYTTPSFNKSVSLTLTQKNPGSAEPGGPKEFWERQFGGDEEREKKREEEERERGRGRERGESSEREEEERPAQRVEGVGDEAFWAGTQKIGVLYVLKGERFLRVSIGGPDEQQVKVEKMKELAKRALNRL